MWHDRQRYRRTRAPNSPCGTSAARTGSWVVSAAGTSFARRLRSATETAAASSSAKPKVGMRAASSTRSGPLTFVKSQLGSVGRIPRATSGAGSSTRSPIAASFGPMRASAGKPSSSWQE